ncbi:MAG: hypothetical protein AB7S40_01590 [Bacteroidales bacterium]|jgi:hypothetical protein
MKIYRTILTIILASTIFVAKSQTIDPTLEVSRDFDARLLEISKSKMMTNFHDSLGRFNLSFNYTIFDKPIKNLYEFTPITSAAIQKEPSQAKNILFLKAGSNFPLNPYGTLLVSPNTGDKFTISFGTNHNSYHSKLNSTNIEGSEITKGNSKINAPHSNTNAFIEPRFRWKSGEIGINATYKNISDSYYGFADSFSHFARESLVKDSLGKKSSIAGVSFFAKSLNKNHNTFHYSAKISYSSLQSESRHKPMLFANEPTTSLNIMETKENHVFVSLDGGAGFSNYNKIMAGATYQASNPRYTDSLTRSNIELHPRYIFRKGRWDFELGLKYNRWWEGQEEDYNIYFSGKAELEMITNKFWLYGILDGQNNFMNYNKLLNCNPWISPTIDIKNIEQPVIARVGFKGKLKERVSFNLYGSYYEFRNQVYFVSNSLLLLPDMDTPANSFNAIYKDETRFGAGADIFYNASGFQFRLNAEYLSFKDENGANDKHYNYPSLTINAHSRYNWRERIVLSALFDYKHNTPTLIASDLISLYPNAGYETNTPSYLRVNINAEYVHNNNLSFFIQLNNILDNHIVEYGTYTLPGFNGGLGLIFKL